MTLALRSTASVATPTMAPGLAWTRDNEQGRAVVEPNRPPADEPTWTGRRYTGAGLNAIRLPLGGIGTGTISLTGRGALEDWELRNRPAKGVRPDYAFFGLWTQRGSEVGRARLLEGELPPPYLGARGIADPAAGLPRFREVEFEALYPFGRVRLSDPDCPLEVELEAFNPLIPTAVDESCIPGALLRYRLVNHGVEPVRAMVFGVCSNLLSPSSHVVEGSIEVGENGRVRGAILRSVGVDPGDEGAGQIGLFALGDGVSVRPSWPLRDWKDSLLEFWDDLVGSGTMAPGDEVGPGLAVASVGRVLTVEPGADEVADFVLSWAFANRREWPGSALVVGGTDVSSPRAIIGNYYTTIYPDVLETATVLAARRSELRSRTLAFSSALKESSLTPALSEAALDTLVALRSETTFITAAGQLAGWEGCNDLAGSCHGSCTHVWNYEWATALLFGDLARTMRDAEFGPALAGNGHMSFRIGLTAETGRSWELAAADGQLGTIVKAYREWQLSGADQWLADLWPSIRRALTYVWTESGWDSQARGVADGCLHHTLDVEYIGPNPLTQFWYLAALRAGEEMAAHVGDKEFKDKCRELFVSGRRFVDEELFRNGFYIQRRDLAARNPHVGPDVALDDWIAELRPSPNPDDQAFETRDEGSTAAPTRLRSDWLRATIESGGDLPHQLDGGCLADQLLGDVSSQLCGLGPVADPDHIREAARSIWTYNHVDSFRSVDNVYRTFTLNGDAGLRLIAYPHGDRPRRPPPYFTETFTGSEYIAAAALILAGFREEGGQAVTEVRQRYEGWNRNPFDEAECGHHYARSMASWAVLLAETGCRYSAVTEEMTIRVADQPARWPWASGRAFGTVTTEPRQDGTHVTLRVQEGSAVLRSIQVTDGDRTTLPAELRMGAGDSFIAIVERSPRYRSPEDS
jgi:non-lysosomal glucosylceramidase